MTLEKAIKTAIEYETKVCDLYFENAKKFRDPVAMKIFKVLADEEQHHVDYLESRLEEWEKTGKITVEKLESCVPSRDKIESNVKTLKERADRQDFGVEIEIFKKALALEVETSKFYKKMVAELPADDQPLFARFVEIEEGHEAIVQAEIDAAQGLGFWFDFMEFGLEKA
ncbi:ferritin family protein [candidate division KSB1 bacterium]